MNSTKTQELISLKYGCLKGFRKSHKIQSYISEFGCHSNDTRCPLYGLTLIPACTNIYIHYKALDLAKTYDIDIKRTKPYFEDVCKYEIKEHFINEWRMSIQNTTLNPILRTYNVLKTRFGTEPYIRSVKDIKYWVAIFKLRVSPHALEIERGRYNSPMTPVNERLCHACQKVEDEFHFMMECKSNSDLCQTFINKLTTRCPNFADLSQR